jgi:hypothetical protein
MAYESNTGLNVHNQYGPRTVGGGQGTYLVDGYINQYVIDQPSQGLVYLFPRGGGVFVSGIDKTFVKTGTVTSVTIGGLEVSGATESAPIFIPATNTGECVQTGMTLGRLVIEFKQQAGYESDALLPAFPSDFAKAVSISVAPTTQTLSLSGVNTATIVATILPSGADQAVVWTSSNPAKATVTSAGLVTGVATGTSNVKATAVSNGALVATCVVTVTA